MAAVSQEVLELLRCPATGQRLRFATPELVAQLEELRLADNLRDRAGNPYAGAVQGGLVTADGALFFPIREGIPVLIVAEAVAVTALAEGRQIQSE